MLFWILSWRDHHDLILVSSPVLTGKRFFRFRKAIVSTSANISGQPAPRCFAEISDEIRQAVDYIVGVRQNEPAGAAPSSIIKLGAHGEVKVIRE